MEEKRWESCNAEALLEEFFSQDDLRQLALSTGELLDCPLLVLDDTFHIAAHHLPLGFSDALFETAVRRSEISYEAGAIISKNAMLTAGWADYVQLPESPYRRRFAPLVSAGVRLGCLICVDTDGHLEKIPPQTWELVEHILSKQLFMKVSRQDKSSETVEASSCTCWTAGFPPPRIFSFRPPAPTWRTFIRAPSPSLILRPTTALTWESGI